MDAETDTLSMEETPAPTEERSSSLSSRMAARREEAESADTEVWALPGRFCDIIAVELRVMGWKRLADIARAHRRVRDETLRALYVACDQLLAATVGFYEIIGDEVDRRHPLPDETWQSLARKGIEMMPGDLTPRQAMLALMRPDTLVVGWWQEWQEWMTERRPEITQEVGRDFSKTG